MKKILFLLLAVVSCVLVNANVRLPKLFGDNMVLQREKPIPVWGWADANEKISVQFGKQLKKTKADKTGHWMIRLDTENAGGPYQLIVTGKNTITISNVLVGEVWICSGQSNMEFHVQNVINAEKEMQDANYPEIRHFKVPNEVSSSPREDIKSGEWKVCSPSTVGEFTAVGYFFAVELYKQLHVPIGLINTSWGGTMIETWTSRDAYENSDEFKTMMASFPAANFDSLANIHKMAVTKNVESLQGPLVTKEISLTWSEEATDDSKWPQMKIPGLWEQQQLNDLDGVVWFRKTIDISAEQAGKEATLQLGMIDDNDITFINGIKVGSTNGYNINRSYHVPAGVLKPGKNVIAVRITDTGGGGGLYGKEDEFKLTIDQKNISLAGSWSFRVAEIVQNAGISPNSYPTLLYNAMISPLLPYAIRGATWYQGEANADRAYQYRKAFPLMITDWRQHWKQGDFPFYFVQLATFNSANGNSEHGSAWAELREAQALTLSLPNTGMAVTTDIGNPTDIHPKNKQDVGKRLAAIALNDLYGKKMEYSGPAYQSMKKEGTKIILSFTHDGAGLMTKDKYGYLQGFEIAGADKHFHYAKAWIDNGNVIVYQEGITDPVAVRYGWADDAGDANLYNKDGFPAPPFRTDNWKGITEEAKYAIGK